MAKSIKNLFSKIVSEDNLTKAWDFVWKVKQKDSEIVSYKYGVSKNLHDLHNSLINKTWVPKPKTPFIKHEKKTREITPIDIEGKIVAQAIYQILSPKMNNKFSKNSYACIKGRGQHMCAENVQRVFFNYHKNFYVFKGDIKGYFKNAKKKKLKQIVRKRIRDKNLVNLLFKFIVAYKDAGIPIGWLTSELFANMYLDELDKFVTKNFKDVQFFRFMDDFIICGTNKERVLECVEACEKLIVNSLMLQINPKSKVYKNHVDFCGYIIYAGYKKPRKRILKSAFRRYKKYIMCGEFKKLFQALPSMFGYTKFCMSRTTIINKIYKLFSPLYIIPHKDPEDYYVHFLAHNHIKDQLTHEKGVKYNGCREIVRIKKNQRTGKLSA